MQRTKGTPQQPPQQPAFPAIAVETPQNRKAKTGTAKGGPVCFLLVPAMHVIKKL
jgi:hypothetical protein